MLKNFFKNLNELISVEGIVTIILTIVFAFMCYNGKVSSEFLTIYAMIITFYFSSSKKDKKK